MSKMAKDINKKKKGAIIRTLTHAEKVKCVTGPAFTATTTTTYVCVVILYYSYYIGYRKCVNLHVFRHQGYVALYNISKVGRFGNASCLESGRLDPIPLEGLHVSKASGSKSIYLNL